MGGCDNVVPHRVTTKEQGSCVMAALSFGGLPLDFQVCLLVHSNPSYAKGWHPANPVTAGVKLPPAFESRNLHTMHSDVLGIFDFCR